MVTFLTILHIIITLSLIGLVLIQDSKGGGMGAFGGGGNSNSVLGATGATSLAAKLTQWFAIAFAISCIALAMTTGRSKKSVVDAMAPVPPAAQVNPGTTPTTPPPADASASGTVNGAAAGDTTTTPAEKQPAASATPAESAPASNKTSDQESTPKK